MKYIFESLKYISQINHHAPTPHHRHCHAPQGQSDPRHESDSEAEYENRRDEAVGRRGAKPMTPVQEKEQKKDR